MNKTYTKPAINVTKLEAEDVIATSGIMEMPTPATTIKKADGTTIAATTSVPAQNFSDIYGN